ncbi:MAG: YkgJ family cysteine cluster protein [Promethearchaeota archaeon]|nr:MAG: YkgJ family cysteine cluster protein [Candidatus Lokiarchaeota archaeon]
MCRRNIGPTRICKNINVNDFDYEITLKTIEFQCLQCGNCCKTKHLCLYPHELDKALNLADKMDIALPIQPLRFRIDFKNEVILDLIYKVKSLPCPFYINNTCNIHENRFIACKKYPFANWTRTPKLFVKLFKFPKFFYEIDKKCTFIKKHINENEDSINKIDFKEEFIFFKKDMDVFLRIENHLDELQKLTKIQLKKENKFKQNFPKKYKRIIDSWDHKPINGYL